MHYIGDAMKKILAERQAEAVTVCAGGCDPIRQRLHPYVAEAAALRGINCCPMWRAEAATIRALGCDRLFRL